MQCEPSSGIKLTAYSCICWLFHRIYYDARNHKHKIIINIYISLMYEFKKIGMVPTSKFVGTGPSSYEKKNYRATVSQILRNTGIEVFQVLGTKYYSKGDEIQTGYLCGPRVTYGQQQKDIANISQEIWRKNYSEKLGRRWDDNIIYILNKQELGMQPN